MDRNLVAKATTSIHASSDDVWRALVDPKAIKQYMFGADVETDWREGGPITWRGEFKGKHFEDKGRVLEVDRGRRLCYTHFSPLSGLPDKPENYHNVVIELADEGDDSTRVTLTQDHNADEKALKHSEENWSAMLAGLKKYVTSKPRRSS